MDFVGWLEALDENTVFFASLAAVALAALVVRLIGLALERRDDMRAYRARIDALSRDEFARIVADDDD